MEYAPALTQSYPPVPWYGNGVPISDMPRIDTGEQLRSTQTALSSTLGGSGIPAGEEYTDNPLQSDTDDGLDTSGEYDE
jgi:hypothetical protein